MKVSFRYRFEAAHRFLNAAAPRCQTPHGHTWRATLTWQAQNGQLNNANMLQEFQSLKSAWKTFIQEVADHSFFFNSEDPLIPHMIKEIPGFRGLPFPGDPTTEMVAILFLKKALTLAQSQKYSGIQPYSVTVDETPVNSVEIDINCDAFVRAIEKIPTTGWWSDCEVLSRNF